MCGRIGGLWRLWFVCDYVVVRLVVCVLFSVCCVASGVWLMLGVVCCSLCLLCFVHCCVCVVVSAMCGVKCIGLMYMVCRVFYIVYGG